MLVYLHIWIQTDSNILAQPRFVAPAEDELGNKVRRPPGGFTQRHAEPEKIFGIHAFNQFLVGCLVLALNPPHSSKMS